MIFIGDLETYPNFFLASFKNIDSKKIYHFEISDRKNDSLNLRKFLLNKTIKYIVGFNWDGFDYPILHETIIKDNKVFTSEEIYKIVEKVVNTKYSSIKDREVKVPYIDLYKLWHYDNKNKATSLKWLEFAMRMKNIQDLPYRVGSFLTDDQKDNTILYCENDLNATEAFFYKSLKQLTLRKEYGKLSGVNMLNFSEGAIAREVFSKAFSKELDIPQWDVRKLRSYRSEVIIKDIIFPYISFEDPINNESLEKFKSKVWRYDQDIEKSLESISFQTKYKNVVREYAEGGLHSACKAGIYESNEEYELWDVDYASYYPHLTFKNNLHPEHIPEKVFNRIYEGYYKDRKLYPKTDVRNYVLKIFLNIAYGFSKDKYNFLYDPKWQLAVCINGQLILTMLTERIFKYIPDAFICFENTDGAMFRIPKGTSSLLEKACKEIGDIVNIDLETQKVQKFITRDVNNYICVIDDKTIKYKGAFEINRDFHKNHSKRIIPLALANYFINNIKPEDTIDNHFKITEYNLPMDKKANTNIEEDKDNYQAYGLFDFCIGSKMKGGNKLYSREQYKVIKDEDVFEKARIIKNYGFEPYYNNTYKLPNQEGNSAVEFETAFRIALDKSKYFHDTELSKTNRYIVSKEGVELIKKLPALEKNKLTETEKYKLKFDKDQMDIFDIVEDVRIEPEDRESNLEVGFKCQVLNILNDEYDESIINDIDKQYYIAECYKIIDKIK